jgi:hypothetical protein
VSLFVTESSITAFIFQSNLLAPSWDGANKLQAEV